MSRLAKRLFAASFAAAAALAAVGPAQAVVYRGSWDPAYGSDLPGLGWRGEAFFDIPADCLGQGDGLYFNVGTCSPQSILSGKVEFYSLLDVNKTTLETLNFDASNFDVSFQMRVTNHKLAGVVGGFLLPEESFISLTDTLPGASHSVFWLGFQDSQSRLGNCQYGYGFSCSINDKTQSTGPMVFAPVPEAEGYVLALAGLGVVGIGMSRRRRASSSAA